MRRPLSLLFVAAFACACDPDSTRAPDGSAAGAGGSEDVAAPRRVTVRVLGINDFHGALEPTKGENDALFGGAARLAAKVKGARTPTSVFVSAGDLIGGSPLASGLFHDEPTILAMNVAGLELNAVGNHEFDEGSAELLRMQSGSCHPVDGCAGDTSFPGAKFKFLGANARVKSTGQTIFPPYVVRDFEGVKIAFVGMTTKNTPATTVTARVQDLDFEDEVDTMNALMPQIRAEGAETVVLLVHEGGAQQAFSSNSNTCKSPIGRVFEIAEKLPSEVKLLVTGHAHQVFNCQLGGRVLMESGARGQAFSVTDLTFEDGRLIETKAVNETVAGTDAPDPAVAGVVDKYVGLAASLGDQEVGAITESMAGAVMGRTVADAMLYAGGAAGAEVALMNPGGVRAALDFEKSGPETVDGRVRYSELFAVTPFLNELTMLSVPGDKLLSVLDAVASQGGLYVAGMTYSQTSSAPAGLRVLAEDVLVNGVKLDLARSYRVVVNAITIAYPEFAGTEGTGLGVDIDAMVGWFKSASPIAPTAERISAK